jgi:hypothetical protein
VSASISIFTEGEQLCILLPDGGMLIVVTVNGLRKEWVYRECGNAPQAVISTTTIRLDEPIHVHATWSMLGCRYETVAVLNGANPLVEEWLETIGPYPL